MSESSPEVSGHKNNWVSRRRRLLLAGGTGLFLLIALIIYLTGGRIMSTDDAYIQAGLVKVSSNVSGQIIAVAVHDNQKVRAGDVLFKLDDRPFRIAVEDAKAQLANARLQVEALQATYQQRMADQKAAEDALAYQKREFNRQQSLAAEGIASKAQLDKATNMLNQAISAAAAANHQTITVLASLGRVPNLPVDDNPNVRQAQAALDRANLNLSYTIVRASISGIVTKVEQLQLGEYINAAVPQFALISDSNIWIEANFKENQLTYIRPGQKASFKIDAYPGRKFNATVVSVSPGTGSSFSLLPPENASGNWVKVVQRLAVRLVIDKPLPNIPLASGMSVTVDIDTKHHRSLLFWRHGDY